MTVNTRQRVEKKFILINLKIEPIRVAARSQAWVCGHFLAGIAILNPAGDIDVL